MAISELTALLGSRARKAISAEELHASILELLAEETGSEHVLLYFWDDTGIVLPLPTEDGQLKTRSEMILSGERGGPSVPHSLHQICLRSSEPEDVVQEVTGILNAQSNELWEVICMRKGETIEGAVCMSTSSALLPKLRSAIEESLCEAITMLDLVTDRYLQLRLVELNEVGLSCSGMPPGRFMCAMLQKACEYIGCKGLSLFTKDPTSDESAFWLVATTPNVFKSNSVRYKQGDNSLTSRIISSGKCCSVHYLSLKRSSIKQLGPVTWRDISDVDQSKSVMHIPVGANETIALLRCTNKNHKSLSLFNAVDMHRAEAIASLLKTWHVATESDFRLASSLMDLSHEITTTAAGIKSIASYAHRAINRPDVKLQSKDIILLKLKDISTSVNSLLAMMPALRRAADDAPDRLKQESKKGFRPYGDLSKPIVESFAARALERGITFKFVGEYQLGIVYADVLDFWPIFHNLISNAVKYTYAGREIIVKMDRGSNTTEFSSIHVLSESIPIRRDEGEQIFRFRYRTDVAKGTAPGDGRGLAIARAKARQLRGDVVLTTAGELNVFSVLIPKSLFAEQQKTHENSID